MSRPRATPGEIVWIDLVLSDLAPDPTRVCLTSADAARFFASASISLGFLDTELGSLAVPDDLQPATLQSTVPVHRLTPTGLLLTGPGWS